MQFNPAGQTALVSKKPKGFRAPQPNTPGHGYYLTENTNKHRQNTPSTNRNSKIAGIKEKTVSRPLRQLYMEILDAANHRRHHLPTYCSKQKRSIQTVSTTTFMTNKHNQSIESRFCWFINSFKH
jgi:hypothetical protein